MRAGIGILFSYLFENNLLYIYFDINGFLLANALVIKLQAELKPSTLSLLRITSSHRFLTD